MSNRALVGIVIVLGLCVALAALNPSREQYAHYLQESLAKALERMEAGPGHEQKALHDALKAHGNRIIESVVASRTIRRNYGLLAVYETRVLDVDIRVVGVAGAFIPLERQDELVKQLGRLVF
jgi:hypothetical protein